MLQFTARVVASMEDEGFCRVWIVKSELGQECASHSTERDCNGLIIWSALKGSNAVREKRPFQRLGKGGGEITAHLSPLRDWK